MCATGSAPASGFISSRVPRTPTLGLAKYTLVLETAQQSPFASEITKDIGRTFMVRHDPALQKSLYNVLLAFSSTNPSVGYCQGMNFIAGILLLVFKSEEAAYSALVGLFAKFELEGLFKPGVPDLHRRQFEFAQFTKAALPDLTAHFKRIGVTTGVFVDKWCMGLFSSYLPVETLVKVWDVFLFEGWKSLIKVGISILAELRSSFLSMDLEQLSTYLRDNTRTQHYNAIALLHTAQSFKVTRAAILRVYSEFQIEQAEHKVEYTDRYPDLSTDEKEAIEKAKAEIEKINPLLKQGVQMYQVYVETMEKEVAELKSVAEEKEKELDEVQKHIEQLSDAKKDTLEKLRRCESEMEQHRGTYMNVFSFSSLTLECRSIQPESVSMLSEESDETSLRSTVSSLTSQLQALQDVHRLKLESFTTVQNTWKEAEAKRDSRAKQLEGFVQMWEMKRRDVFLRLSRKLRPSLLIKCL